MNLENIKNQADNALMPTYAHFPVSIESGSGGRDWTKLGYSAEPNIFDDGFNYAISLLDK